MMGLLTMGSAACATTGAVPRPFPGAPASASADADALRRGKPAAPGATADKTAGGPVVAPGRSTLDDRRSTIDGRAVAQFALGFRGVPYRLGGADPAGFDCSGLVQYVFAQYGVSVPRVVEQQYGVGEKIKPSEIKPGDLIFFNTKKQGSSASHVAIAIGADTFVHAPNSTGVVRVGTLRSSYWGSRYLGARRVEPSASTN